MTQPANTVSPRPPSGNMTLIGEEIQVVEECTLAERDIGQVS